MSSRISNGAVLRIRMACWALYRAGAVGVGVWARGILRLVCTHSQRKEGMTDVRVFQDFELHKGVGAESGGTIY